MFPRYVDESFQHIKEMTPEYERLTKQSRADNYLPSASMGGRLRRKPSISSIVGEWPVRQ